MSKLHTDGSPDPATVAANQAKRAELADSTPKGGGHCPVCGEPSGRGRYGYPTVDCGSEDCRKTLRARRRAKLSPTSGAGDWKPGLPGQGGQHR